MAALYIDDVDGNSLCYDRLMKKGITCTSWVLIFYLLAGCTNNQMVTERDQVSGWQTEHVPDGKTQFKVNIGSETFYYGIRLIGLYIDNKRINFDHPRISIQPELITKQWTPYLKEYWFMADANHWVIEFDQQWLQTLKTDRFTLLYEIDSNHQSWISGNFAPVLSFHDSSLSGSQLSAIRPIISTYWSYCPHVRNISLHKNGVTGIDVLLDDQENNVYLTGLLKPDIRGPSVKHEFFAALNQGPGEWLQTVYHQEVRADGQLKDRLKVVEQRLNEEPRQSLITEWPDSKTCEFTAVNFAASVAINNNWLAVSATNDCQIELFSGAVYLFHKQNEQWKFHTKLKAGVVSRDQNFGLDLKFHGDRMYVLDSENNLYVFKLIDEQWVQSQIINIGEHAIIEEYAVMGNELVLAVENVSETSLELWTFGFDGNKWSQTNTLKPEFSHGVVNFWQAVSLGDQHLAATASVTDETSDLDTHVIHLFQKQAGHWQPDLVIMPPDEQFVIDTDRTGFGSNLLFHKGDLYASDGGFLYQSEALDELPNECVFADKSGVYQHYVRNKDQWILHRTLTINRFSDLVKHLLFPTVTTQTE